MFDDEKVRADAASQGIISFTQVRTDESLENGQGKVVLTTSEGTVTLTVGSGLTNKTNTAALQEFKTELTVPNKATLLGTKTSVKVEWKASFAVPGSRYVEGDGYEGAFTIYGPAVAGDPFLQGLYTDPGGDYLTFDQVPYFSGDTSALKALFDGAATGFVDVAVLGDSQETLPSGSGIHFLTELNRLAFRRYGQSRKLPFYRFGTDQSDEMWCVGTQDAGADELAADGPNLPVFSGTSSSGNSGPMQTLYPDAGSLANATDGIYFPDDTGTLRWQVMLKRNDSLLVEEARIAHLSHVDDREYFGSNTRTNYDSSGLDLNSAADEYVLFESGDLSYLPAQPWHNCFVHGLNAGNTVETGLLSVGGRFIDTARDQGMCWTSFSTGSLTADDHLTGFPLFGGIAGAFSADPFNAVFICLGTNDAGTGDTPAEFKAKIASLISKVRTDFGANIPVVLLSEPPRDDYGGNAINKNNFDRYPAALGELAEETDGVSFLNLTRKLDDVSSLFGVDSGDYLTDAVHLEPFAQRLAAEKVYELIDELV